MRDTVFFKQAELLLRILPLIHKEEAFALKGGTAAVKRKTPLSAQLGYHAQIALSFSEKYKKCIFLKKILSAVTVSDKRLC